MSKKLSVQEVVEKIKIGNGEKEISEDEFERLEIYFNQYIKDKKITHNPMQREENSIKFINYVGLITIKGLILEINPKINLAEDILTAKKSLLKIICKTKGFDINVDSYLNSKKCNISLLELISFVYLNSLEEELRKGISRNYRVLSENLNILKGKLNFREHINKNSVNKIRAYCEYDEYSDNNLLNQILKFATMIIFNKIRNTDIQKKGNSILQKLGNVEYRNITSRELQNFRLGKENRRFFKVFELAKFIIESTHNENSINNKSGFSMLFPVHELFEKYIGIVLSEMYGKENVVLQDSSKYLFKNKSNKIRPDIIVKRNEEIIIFDTKWKNVNPIYDEENDIDSKTKKENVKREDIYQMYIYGTVYEKCSKVILVYPHDFKEEWKQSTTELIFERDETKSILIRKVRLDKYFNTVEDLREMIK